MNHPLYDNLHELCRMRRSVRNFSDQPVDKAIIDKIMDVALTSPYSTGRKDWEILVVDDPQQIRDISNAVKRQVARTLAGVKDEFVSSFENYSKYFYSFAGAPVLLVPTFRILKGTSFMFKEEEPGVSELDRDGTIKSIACVVMLVLLAAQSLELGACFVHGALIAEDEIGKLVKIKPGRNIGAIVPIGYPAGERE